MTRIGWIIPALFAVFVSHLTIAQTVSDSSAYAERFVVANGIRLEYLDWGGTGSALILIHGGGDNPHNFDDLAPAFRERFHVIAYARRGEGRSEAKPPYDTATFTEDLRGLMDALGISQADLIGWSMGGNEITGMAALHPERVRKIVYLEAAYDWGDPDFAKAFKVIESSLLDPPTSALNSFDAFRAYEKSADYTQLDDMSRIDAYLRDLVIVQPDGTLKFRTSSDVMNATMASVLRDRRDYTKVRCPVLAIYSSTFLDTHASDPERRREAIDWERKYMIPFREKSEARIRRELRDVRVVNVSGTHDDFVFTSKERVVQEVRKFLSR